MAKFQPSGKEKLEREWGGGATPMMVKEFQVFSLCGSVKMP